MTPYELASVLMAFVALVIAILSYGNQAVNSILTMNKADRANEIAEKALKITLRDYKEKLVPSLEMSYTIHHISLEDEFEFILCEIVNKTHGKVTVGTISTLGAFNIVLDQYISFPFEMLYNNHQVFQLKINEKARLFLRKQAEGIATDLSESVDQHYAEMITSSLKRLLITAYTLDEAGTKYEVKFQLSDGSDKFNGIPIER